MRLENIKEIKNRVQLIGQVVEVEEEGLFEGIEQQLLLVKTPKYGGGHHFLFVIMPKSKHTDQLVENKSIIRVDGIINSSFTFNNINNKHEFVHPNRVEILDNIPDMADKKEFYLNYTQYNRIVLVGKIHRSVKRKYVKSKGMYVNKFKLRYVSDKDMEKTANCTLWDTVNDLVEMYPEKEIQVIGSMIAVNKKIIDYSRGKRVSTQYETDKYNTYNLLIQKILDLDTNPEIKASEIIGQHM